MALSFTEKRTLQKTVATNLAALAAGNVGFTDKRRLQKEITEAMAKLNAVVEMETQTPATKADFEKVLPLLKQFIGRSQLSVVQAGMRGEEGQFFIDKMLEIAKVIETMPDTYKSSRDNSATVYLHYYNGGSDWYIIEKDKGAPDDTPEDAQSQAWGYTILNGDTEMAETGYISIAELIQNNVELDFHWSPKTLGDLPGRRTEKEEDETPPQDGAAAVQKMKDAVVSYGGELIEIGGDFVTFTLHGGKGGQALLNYRAGGYRVRYGENGTEVTDSYINADDAVGEYFEKAKGTTSQSQNLLDLQAGKFDSLEPLAFLGKLKEIADEINDIEPLKGPAIAYIEKNSERVGAVMESAVQEAFGKLWGAGA